MSAPNAETPSGPQKPARSNGGRRKMVLRLALLVVVGVAGLTVLSGFGSLLSTVTRSGQSADVFTNAAELPDELLDAVTWLPDDEAVSEPISPLMRIDVTSSWIRAWSQMTVAAETGTTSGMEAYFSDSALEGVLAGAQESSGRPVHQLSHELQATFLSADKQVLGLTAENSRFIRAELFDDGRRRFFQTDESYEAVLVLEDGNWRIHHWVRRAIDGRWLVDNGAPTTNEVLTELGIAGPPIDLAVQGGLARNGSSGPGSSHAFGDEPLAFGDESLAFGDESQAPAARVPQELLSQIDAALDAWESSAPDSNVVRFPITTDTALPVEAIVELLNAADSRGLLVVVALFDGRTDFAPSSWESDRRYLQSVRENVTGHPALASIELSVPPDVRSDLSDAWQVSLNGPLVSIGER